MSNPYTSKSYMMVIGSVLAIGAASELSQRMGGFNVGPYGLSEKDERARLAKKRAALRKKKKAKQQAKQKREDAKFDRELAEELEAARDGSGRRPLGYSMWHGGL